jgi:thioester reductase-like protein
MYVTFLCKWHVRHTLTLHQRQDIVSFLLRKHPQSKILCLNRSENGEQRTLSALSQIDYHSPSDLTHMHFLVSDTTKPGFDLDVAHHQIFVSEVDEIIFNAWNPNWGLPLKSFGSLIGSVRNLIELCAASSRRPRVTFMSSMCSIGEWQREHPERPLVPEEVAWDPASAMANGYGESKCIAEQLLAHAHALSGLRVAIIRAAQVGGPSPSVAGNKHWPVPGWLYVIIKTSKQLGYWPTYVNALDWIPVDALAEGITNITTTQPNDEAIQVYNMVASTRYEYYYLLLTSG